MQFLSVFQQVSGAGFTSLFEKEDMYEGVVVQDNYCNNIQQSESGGRPPGAALEGVGYVGIDRR